MQMDEDTGRLAPEKDQQEHDDDATAVEGDNQGADSSDTSSDEEDENQEVVGKDCGRLTYQGKVWVIPEDPEKRRNNIILAVTMLDNVKTKYTEAKEANRHNVAALKKVNAENEQLKKEIATLQAQVAKFGKNDATVAKIDNLVKKKLFPFVKFISCEDKQIESAKSVYKWILQEEHGTKITDDDIDEVHMAGWISRYGPECTSAVNKARGNSTQRMLTEYKNLMKDNQAMFGGSNTGPTVEELTKCALRDIDMSNNREVMIMEWYITSLFCKLAQKFCQGAHNFATLLLTHTFCFLFCSPGHWS